MGNAHNVPFPLPARPAENPLRQRETYTSGHLISLSSHSLGQRYTDLLRSPSCRRWRQSSMPLTSTSCTPATKTPLSPSRICRFSFSGRRRSCKHHGACAQSPPSPVGGMGTKPRKTLFGGCRYPACMAQQAWLQRLAARCRCSPEKTYRQCTLCRCSILLHSWRPCCCTGAGPDFRHHRNAAAQPVLQPSCLPV